MYLRRFVVVSFVLLGVPDHGAVPNQGAVPGAVCTKQMMVLYHTWCFWTKLWCWTSSICGTSLWISSFSVRPSILNLSFLLFFKNSSADELAWIWLGVDLQRKPKTSRKPKILWKNLKKLRENQKFSGKTWKTSRNPKIPWKKQQKTSRKPNFFRTNT